VQERVEKDRLELERKETELQRQLDRVQIQVINHRESDEILRSSKLTVHPLPCRQEQADADKQWHQRLSMHCFRLTSPTLFSSAAPLSPQAWS